jgi:aryl-phospho-beta-D-glucosidase BglC (GH1 family)
MKIVNLARHMRAAACALGVLFGCNAVAAGYHVANGKIYEPNGQEVQVRGISHFGFNATILQPQYLWAMGWKEQIAQIKSLGFNAVRVPFVPETLYNNTPVDKLSYVDPGRNPELLGKTPLQVLDLWMAEADRVGLFIMLDFHSISSQRQYPTWWVSNPADFNLTYNKQAYTPADWTRDLAFVAKRYANLPHFFGIDVFNEPYGEVRWTHTNPNLSWKGSVETASKAILAANPNLLIMVQGISGNFDGVEDSNIPINWGEDLQPQGYAPLAIAQDKLVFVPHTYGPDVFNKSTFSASNYPANLSPQWDTLFGKFSQVHAVIPGEWGGHYGDGLGSGGAKDVTWQNAFVDYMISKGISSSFYWSYTPNSGDTGGVLDNNLQVRSDKMNLLKKLWGAPPVASPSPTPSPTPTPSPAPTVVQPSISGFSPASGPVGTVVTVNGTGFTGVNKAWMGKSHDVVYRVLSDRQVQVTIPAGATDGSIGLFNSKYAVFSATFFKVTSGTVTPTPTPTPTPAPTPTTGAPPQPAISTFSPAAGGVGTVVTINGAGFTGLNQAWVGNAHGVAVRVISDSQVQVTIPTGATTGAIGIFNSQHAAFTATSFTMR